MLNIQIKARLQEKLIAIIEKEGLEEYQYIEPVLNLVLKVTLVKKEGQKTNTCFFVPHKNKIYKFEELVELN